MRLFLYILISLFVLLGCSDFNSNKTKKVDIKVAFLHSVSKKLFRKAALDIKEVRLDIQSQKHIFLKNGAMVKIISKNGNFWIRQDQALPLDTNLTFIAKAYNNSNALVFKATYSGLINDTKDIIMNLVSLNEKIEQRPVVSSIVFNKDKTKVTFNIFNPNEDDLNYTIRANSLGSFSPSSGTLHFSSSINFNSLKVAFSPPTHFGSYLYSISLTNSNEDMVTTIFTIDIPKNLSLHLEALYSDGTKLYAIDNNQTVTLLRDDLALLKNNTSNIIKPVIINNYAYFVAYSDSFGYELYKSDGTSSNTTLVKDINPNNNYYAPFNITAFNNKLYFNANDGNSGMELWVSEGNESNTYLFKDINLNGSSYPANFVTMQDSFYFSAYSNYSTDLYRSDGTENGTVMVKKINPNGNSDVYEITKVNETLYFRAKDSSGYLALWRSDGSKSGTYKVKGLLNRDFNIYNLTEINGTLYFIHDVLNGGVELWKCGGDENSTIKVATLSNDSDARVNSILKLLGNKFYFTLKINSTEELWVSSLESNTTTKIFSFENSSFYMTKLESIGDILYFKANDGNSGYELYKSDGTTNGTVMVKDINSNGDSYPEKLTNINGVLYFIADDGSGKSLWKSDGSEQGTVKVNLP